MTHTGDLKQRIGFYRPIKAEDNFGNTNAGYGEKPDFCVRAKVVPKLGGESVQAARLAGRKFVNITIRHSIAGVAVGEDWLAKDERAGTLYNIRSIIDPDQKRQWLELLCEEGVAT